MSASLVVRRVSALTPPHHPWREVELPGRGTTFACDVAGPSVDAPVVVLLHGLMATGALNWGAYVDGLSQHFRIVVLDHRGHGRGIPAAFSLEACADDVVALLDVLGIERAILAGYSMGGPIAQLTWRRHPERVSGLVLCATAATFRRTPMDAALLSLMDGTSRFLAFVPDTVVARVRTAVFGSLVSDAALVANLVDAFARHDDLSIRTAARAVHGFSSVDWLGGVDVPCAVVVMTRDRVVPPHRQEMLARLLARAAVVRVPADHLACNRAERLFGPALLAACGAVAHDVEVAETRLSVSRWVHRLRQRWQRRSRSFGRKRPKLS